MLQVITIPLLPYNYTKPPNIISNLCVTVSDFTQNLLIVSLENM